MPPSSPTTPHTFATGEPSLRWEEPYVTAGVNRKFYGVIPRGVYRGFELAATGIAYQLSVVADPDKGDHVAVCDTTSGYLLTIRKTGDFTVTLDSGYAGSTVVLALYIPYSTSTTTTATLRAYTEAQYLAAVELEDLVVLGTVTVPAGGIVLAAGISGSRREVAALRAPSPWAQALVNPLFERSGEGWTLSVSGSTLAFSTTSGHLLTAQNRAYLLTYGGSSTAFSLSQVCGVPAHTSRRMAYGVYLKVLQAATAGTVFLVFTWHSAAGALVGTSTVSVPVGSVDADHRLVEGMVVPPAGAARLWSVALTGTGLTFASSAAAVVVSMVRVLAEPLAAGEPSDRGYAVVPVGETQLRDPAGSDAEDFARLFFSGTNLSSVLTGSVKVQGGAGSLGVQAAQFLAGLGLIGATQAPYTARHAALPCLTTGTWVLLYESADATLQGARVYYRTATTGNVPALVLTLNAKIADDSGTPRWTKDIDGNAAAALYLTPAALNPLGREAGSNGFWDDAGWTGDTSLSPLTSPTAVQTSRVAVGSGLTSTPLTSRVEVQVAGTGTRTLLMQLGTVRLYAVNGGVQYLDITVNAEWDGTDWDTDDNTVISGKFTIGHPTRKGLDIRYRAAGAGTWSDSSWTDLYAFRHLGGSILEMRDGVLTVLNATTASNPAASTAPTANTLYASTMPKAWGVVSTVGTGGGTFNTGDQDGFNATWAFATASTIRVTFGTAMANANYAVIATNMTGGTDYAFPHITARTTSYFDIQWADVSPGAINTDNTPFVFSFMVMGKQA